MSSEAIRGRATTGERLRRAPLGLLLLVAMIAGCSSGRPRARLGCLPYPHTFTFFEVADPADLGVHQYDEARFWGRSTETERGIIYTCRAGFLDIAHVRETVDWMRYMSDRVEPALRAGAPGIEIYGRELTWYHVTFDYPDDWDTLDFADRDELIDELAIRVGAQLAYDVVTWHEIITWFGYKRWVVIPEDPSSFTYEDVMSHVVGLRVADRALRDHDRAFDDAVTVALADELDRLGALPPEETLRAIDLVEGEWWRGDESLVRHLDTGVDDGVVEPMLVVEMECCGGGPPPRFELPALDDVCGRDMRSFYRVEIGTGILEREKLRSLFAPPPDRFEPRLHFTTMVRAIQREVSVEAK